MNKGIYVWNADIVTPTQIEISGTLKQNSTSYDDVTFSYWVEEIITDVITLTRTCNRVTDLSTTPGADEWRLTTGITSVGQGGPPPFFRRTSVFCGSEFDDATMTWTASRTYTIEVNYGPGGPADSFDDFSGDVTASASFGLTDQELTWIVGAGGRSVEDAFNVDIFTLKKGGSSDFGFTKTDTTSNPNPSLYTAWDWSNSVTVTCS